MTVSTNTSRWTATGNGVTVNFTYTSKIFANTDLKVYVDGVLQTLTTHYSVSGVGVDAGGTVTFVTAPANGTAVLIVREVPYTQGIALLDGTKLPVSTLNGGYDRDVILAQQLYDLILRALRQPEADIAAIGRLPLKADRASKYWGGDANGDPVGLAAPAGTTIVSAFGATIIVAADAAAVRALLALGTAALEAIGTAGGTLGKLNANKTDSGTNTFTGVQHFTKAQIGDVSAALVSAAGALPIDTSLGNNFEHTLTENTTLGLPSNLVKGQWFAIGFTQHAAAAKTLAYNAKYKFVGSTPAITTVLSGKALLVCYVQIATGGSEVILTTLTNFG